MLAISNYLFLYLFVVTVNCNSYCGPTICNGTLSHTFCKYLGPSKKCYRYDDVKLSPEEKIAILSRLNQRRSFAAHGGLGYATAANMIKLRWVEELAKLAQRWADQCRPPSNPDEKDICHSVNVGQCVASIVGDAPGLLAESLADIWFMQSMNFKMFNRDYIVLAKKSNYEDFAQMIWANTHMVGCGRSRFTTEINDKPRVVERLVCNFAPRGPPVGAALWIPGPPTSNCPPRTKGQLDGLCSYPESSEEIDRIINLLEKSHKNSVPAYAKVRRELREHSAKETNESTLGNLNHDLLRNSNRENYNSYSLEPMITTEPPINISYYIVDQIMNLFPFIKGNNKAHFVLQNFLLMLFGMSLVL